MKKKLRIHHDQEYFGLIQDNEVYEKLKSGETDWSPHMKEKIKMVKIPVDLFYRLMDLDKNFDCTKGSMK